MFFKKKDDNAVKQERKTEPSPAPSVTPSTSPNPKKGFSLFGKACCGIISLMRIALSCYAIVDLIRSNSNVGSSKESYLTLTNKNINETKEVLNGFKQENQKKLNDFYFIGSKLYLSESKITPSIYNNTCYSMANGKDIALLDITSNVTYNTYYSTNIKSNHPYIDLDSVKEGDYLFYPYSGEDHLEKKDIAPYSFDKESAIEETIYTFPSQDSKKERRRITLKNNRNSPYAILTVKDCGSHLPSDTYDVLIRNQQYILDKDGGYSLKVNDATSPANSQSLSELAAKRTDKKGYKTKVVSSLAEAVKTKAKKLIVVTEKDTYVSLFASGPESSNVRLLPATDLKGYDEIPEIREATGKLDHAGENYYRVPYNSFAPSYDYIGKEAVRLPYETLKAE